MEKKKNDEILNNKKEKEKFINEWKIKLSQKLGISPDDIIITNLRKGSLEADILLRTNTNFDRLVKILNGISLIQNMNLKEIKKANILNGIVLSPDMFDSRGNIYYDYKIFDYRLPYKKPIGWRGYGLNVVGQYDGGDSTWLGMSGTYPGEWRVAYHVISLKFVKSLLINKFKQGERQLYENDDDINHPGQKVGVGIYVTPEFSIVESYAQNINGYKCIFMCKINPKTVRIPKTNPDYCVVRGKSNDIRPYRLLIKYVG